MDLRALSSGADDGSLLSNQATVTSQSEESNAGSEVAVKGREFYDKLLVRFYVYNIKMFISLFHPLPPVPPTLNYTHPQLQTRLGTHACMYFKFFFMFTSKLLTEHTDFEFCYYRVK